MYLINHICIQSTSWPTEHLLTSMYLSGFYGNYYMLNTLSRYVLVVISEINVLVFPARFTGGTTASIYI